MSRTLDDEGRTDEALMSRAQAGDIDAFAELYDRHAERALRVARSICRDPGPAEAAVLEGFLAIWRSRAGYGDRGAGFQAWSMQAVTSRAIDSLRDAAVRPPDRIGGGEHEEPLASLRRLPEALVEVIVLAVYGELSHSEIAAQLGLEAGTVEGRTRLGLEKLRREMRPSDPI